MEHDTNNSPGWAADSETVADALLERSQTQPKSPTQNITLSDKRYTDTFEGETVVIDSTNWRHSNLLKGQIMAAFGVFVLFGLSEQTIGTIIPILQKDYAINDVQTSYIFLASISGYISMGLMYGSIQNLIGLRGIITMACSSMTLAYVVLSTAPPYPIFIIFTVFHGIGLGALDASCNAWMGTLVESNQLLGILHGCFGIGCSISPVLISHLLKKAHNPWKWNNYYLVLAGVASALLVTSHFLFKYETAYKYRYLVNQKLTHAHVNGHQADNIELDSWKATPDSEAIMEETRPDDEAENADSETIIESATLMDSLKSKLVWIFSILLFFYVGGEASFGSWLITYLIRIKDYDYKLASYMATSFWCGLMSGRMAGGFITVHLFSSELVANFAYCLVSTLGYLFFILASWSAWVWVLFIIVFVTGFAVGPIFPTTIVAAIGILHPKFHASGVGLICAFGGGGGAGLPFLVGLVAESSTAGLKVFPLMVFLIFLVVLLLWGGIHLRYSRSYRSVAT